MKVLKPLIGCGFTAFFVLSGIAHAEGPAKFGVRCTVSENSVEHVIDAMFGVNELAGAIAYSQSAKEVFSLARLGFALAPFDLQLSIPETEKHLSAITVSLVKTEKSLWGVAKEVTETSQALPVNSRSMLHFSDESNTTINDQKTKNSIVCDISLEPESTQSR